MVEENLAFGSDAELLQQYQNNMNLPRWQLDLSSELWKFRLTLQGLIPNPEFGLKDKEGVIDSREYVEVPGARMVNHQGAIAIFNKLSSEVTKVAMDTNIDSKIIGRELVAFEYDFPTWLLLRSADFELSEADYDTICEIAIRLVKFSMQRSVGGWKGNLINAPGTTREVYHQGISNEHEEKSRFRLFGR